MFYLVIDGLDKINFKNSMEECIEGIYGGAMNYQDPSTEYLAECAAWDKDFGW